MTIYNDIIHSKQNYVKYTNRTILAILQHRPLKLGRLTVLQETHTGFKILFPIASNSFPVTTHLIQYVSDFHLKKH